MSLYLEHWGFRVAPFSGGLDVRTFCPLGSHEEALARLHFLVEGRRRAGLLLGASGAGKSLLLAVAAKALAGPQRHVVRLQCLDRQGTEFLHHLATSLNLSPSVAATAPTLWLAIEDQLQALRYERRQVVLLCDDTDEATGETLSHLARLVQMATEAAMPMTLVLASPESRMGLLGRRLLELVDLRIDLRPWDFDEMHEFLRLATARAGAGRELFTTAALARLHDLSLGIPRRVCQLADLVLLAGAGQGVAVIDDTMLEEVYDELGVLDTTAALP